MRQQYIPRTFQGSDGETYTMLEAQYTPHRNKAKLGRDWFECPITGRWIPKSSGVKIRGVYYDPEVAEEVRLKQKGENR